MAGIERDITGNNDFERIHNESMPFYSYKTDITPVNILNGPKNPVLTSVKERGELKIQVVNATPSGTGNTDVYFTIPKNKKWTIKTINAVSSGTATGNYVQALLNVGVDQVELDAFSPYTFGSTITLLNDTYNNITINEDVTLKLRFNLSAYTSGTVIAKILYMEFDEA